MMGAYRLRKDANPLTSASQRNRSAAPENRVGKERNSARRRSEGRARLYGGVRVCGGGVGGGVSALFGCELTDAATDWVGEGTRVVDGVSRIDDGSGGIFSGEWVEVRMGDCGGGTCCGELCTFLIVWTVRL